MSGGQLVVLDRLGRDVKRYPLPEGLATLGSDTACDIRVMLPTVSPHHATVVVHANQTVVRNVSTGETLVNGRPVSVAALRHRDTIEIGGRALRWEYTDQHAERPLAPQPALYPCTRALRGNSPKRGRRGSAAAPGPAREPDVRLALELQHRASMPGQLGRQVAIVQPQRRDAAASNGAASPARPSTASKRGPAATATEPEAAGRPRRGEASLQGTTKASLWIELRKRRPASSGGRSLPRPSPSGGRSPASSGRRSVSGGRSRSVPRLRVTKIEAPTTVDHTKQAALLLMTRRSQPNKTPLSKSRASNATPNSSVTSQRGSGRKSRGRPSRAQNITHDVTLVELSDFNLSQSTDNTYGSPATTRSSRASHLSPLLPSPKKSALKDPTAKKSTRKTESIKFDLSNLESEQSQDVFMISDVTKNADNSQSETDITLHYDSSVNSQSPSPSPRKSIHSRSSRILEHGLGISLSEPQNSIRTLTPNSPKPRKSSRVSMIVQNALETSGNSRYSQRTTKSLSDESYDTTVASAFKTRTLSPRSIQNNMESYSIVDLVSIDSKQSESSIYNSMRSTKSSDTAFGTPQNSVGRKTRSTIDPSLLTSSTPYVAKTTRSKRSLSSPNISKNTNTSQVSRGSNRRSKSLSTPEDTQKHMPVISTRVSRASRSRSRINDSDLLLISTVSDDDSPKSSKRASRATKSVSSPKSPVISPKSLSASMRKSKSVSSAESSPRSNTGRSKSILSPKSPITSPKSNVSLAIRKTKSVSPKSPILSPKSNISVTRKTKSKTPLSSPSYNTSRKTRSLGSPKSPLLSPKSASANITRKTKSISSPKSPVASPKPNTSARTTRNKLSISPTNDGFSTPENRQSPVEVGTPVLSIQSLLDSSQSSLTSLRSANRGRASLRRKTIGGIPPKPKKGRASLKSKSFNFGARKTASRLSRESDDTVHGTTPREEDVVTPKSAVKLVQEAVKNKHSTAKKPLSKRSIIDDLNESDIVKQLFNSPVKRKLSQSMTEFSRKQLFDDDDVVSVKRPTRHTTVGQMPDNSISNESGSYTPEVFVSPLGTPNNSPNLTGIKRLFRKQTPENDLRNVRGVKGLLRTPRARRSVKNDLTRVSGVKNVFARSPKNRLSDVRVKEVFVASPKNDLRRVTGVKSLFQSQKERKSKNDLRDVRGVKQLFAASSPVNDLRNVSGVKKVLRKNSPRNDLTDVRGVRNMFRQEKQQENVADVSGIEELFNDSNHSYRDSEALFDRLIGKPPIKAVYSRTFTKKSEKPLKKRRRSLNISIDEIIAKPEEWIQKELERRLQKKSRELQKLATDTVEGNAPMRASRVRNSTIVQADSGPRKRSTAENYSAHTLPIKKRSLVQSSRENSRVSSSNGTRVLPIKKRALVHSTPLKGRASLVLADLGRVSPIALDHSQGFSTTVVEAPVLQTTRRNTKAKAIVVTSPKKTRGKISVVVSPKKAPVVVSPKKTIVISPKNTRNARKNNSATKKRAVLVAAKKAPVMSPSPTPKKEERRTRRKKLTETETVADVEKPKSPKRTRGTKVSLVVSKPSPKMKPATKAITETETVADVEKPKSPKRTRGMKVSLVVSKPSPKMKPATKAKVSNAPTSVEEVPEKLKRTRKTTAPTESVETKTESPKKSVRVTRNRKTTEVTKEATDKTKTKAPKTNKNESVEEKAVKTRGKKNDGSVEIKKAEGRATRGKKSDAVEQKVEAPKRGRKADVEVEEKPVVPSKRGKKGENEKPVALKKGKVAEVEQKPVATRRGRNAELGVEKVVSPKRGRKTKEVEPQPARRRNTKAVGKPESPKRGKKTEDKIELPAQTRGRKTDNAQKEVKTQKRGQKADITVAQMSNTSVSPKGKRGKASEPVQAKRTTRGRKAEPEVETSPTLSASKPAVNRKRKSTASEELPRKVRKTRDADLRSARGRPAAQMATEVPPATRKRKTAVGTPVKAAKETKRNTRGKR